MDLSLRVAQTRSKIHSTHTRVQERAHTHTRSWRVEIIADHNRSCCGPRKHLEVQDWLRLHTASWCSSDGVGMLGMDASILCLQTSSSLTKTSPDQSRGGERRANPDKTSPGADTLQANVTRIAHVQGECFKGTKAGPGLQSKYCCYFNIIEEASQGKKHKCADWS